MPADQREALLRALDEHKREFRLAIDDLRAAANPRAVLDDAIRDRPGMFILTGIAAGLWLGRRRNPRARPTWRRPRPPP